MSIGVVAASYVASAAYVAAVLADTPLAYYRLGESSGTTMNDGSGNARHGTYSGTYTLGAAGLLPGDTDKAVDFTNGAGQVAYAAWMNASPSFTVEAIINPDTVVSARTIAAKAAPALDAWQLRQNGAVLEFYIANGGWTFLASPAGALTAGTRYHVAASWDGTTRRLYINGAEVANAVAGGPAANASGFSIGMYSTSTEPYDGRIDEVAFYGAALSAARILAHYNASLV